MLKTKDRSPGITVLKYNKEDKVNAYIHLSRRNSLKTSPARNVHIKMNIQQQLKETADGPKLLLSK